MSESKAPTPDEVARLRSHVASCQRHKLASATVDTAQLVALLAALDAAELERDELARWKATHSWSSTLRTRAETAEARVAELEREREALLHSIDVWKGGCGIAIRERDEARALYRAAIGDEVDNG